MDNEPDLKLAMAMHSSPGAYALLLGSGLSTAAGIPTGWDIVLDLIARLALANGEDPPDDPEAWYAKRFGEEPDYAKLLAKVAKTATERRALLRGYFEPTDAEREQGLKVPTAAHRAIAELVRARHVRVILTTNFDPLTEQALEAAGVHPVVIATDDALKGAPPLHQAECVVVKLHRDYRDTRIKNTPEELAAYSPAMNRLLDRIFDEYGLLVCGWSGEWDIALRNALLRCNSHRFSTFWVARSEPRHDAKQVIAHRAAEVVRTSAADAFFPSLVEKLASLRDINASHPVSTAVAVTTVKRYVAEERHRVRLHDLMVEEIERAYAEVAGYPWDEFMQQRYTAETFAPHMHRLEAVMGRLCAMGAALAYFGERGAAALLTLAVERLVQPTQQRALRLPHLYVYPAVLFVYSAGIAALAAGRYENLAAVIHRPKLRETDRQERAAIYKAHVWDAFDGQTYKLVPRENAAREHTPASNYLLDHLHPLLRAYVPDPNRYEDTFDLFEYILGLTYLDVAERSSDWAPVGRYMWRWIHDDWSKSPGAAFVRDGVAQGDSWEMLHAGFFGGSTERRDEILSKMEAWTKSIANRFY